jgi:hypothetical protein
MTAEVDLPENVDVSALETALSGVAADLGVGVNLLFLDRAAGSRAIHPRTTYL